MCELFDIILIGIVESFLGSLVDCLNDYLDVVSCFLCFSLLGNLAPLPRLSLDYRIP